MDSTLLSDWLLGDGRRLDNPAQFLEAFCHRLRAAGVPVDRATIGAPLLHPIAQSAFAIWDAQRGLTASWVRWDDAGLEKLRNSPIHAIYTAGQGLDWRLDDADTVGRFPIGPELREAGFTHYLAFALPFTDRAYKAFTTQTKHPEGFSAAVRDVLDALVPAIATVFEGYMQRVLATTLMDTYVGTRAGARVLDGHIARGDGDTIRAVIWISDLRGFTTLAAGLPPQVLIARLNHYFGVLAAAVAGHGGEVLKFIGDALLAVFPVDGEPRTAVANAEAAVDEARVAAAAPDWPADLAFGTALHLGEVFYGNVGGETRLDFTVIGPSVNLVSRVEGLCAGLGEPVLVTEAIARHSARAYRACGVHALKGVAAPVAVFAPLPVAE